MKKTVKKIICMMLALILAVPVSLQQVRAEETDEILVETVAVSMTDSAVKNYFSFVGGGWTINTNEAYATADSSTERSYEIHFDGNAISVFAIKAPAHGTVRFSLDNGSEETVNLNNSSRTNPEKVYSASGLTEGAHVLKAVCVTSVNQISYAEVTHKPYKGGIPNLGGTIEDTNHQYTQNRYSEIAAKNTSAAELSAWKNDKATSELVLFSKGCNLEDVSVTASDLTSGTNTIASENIKTTFIKSVKAYSGAYPGYGNKDREIPTGSRAESSDILYQQGGSIDIAWNSLQPVWVEFQIPKDAEAGIYTGTLTASAKGIDKPLVFTYTVKVADIVLPDADTFADTFDIELWQYPYSSAEYYGVEPFSEEHFACMESSMLKYKEIGGHAITTTILEEAWSGQTYSKNEVHYPSMIKWTKKEDGSFSYDYTDFDAWVTFCKKLGIGDKIVLYSIAPWHGSFTYWDGDELVYEAYTAGNERYVEVWTDFLTDLIRHLEEKGWFEESYIGIDERGFSAAAFDVIESVKNREGESLKTAGAMDGFVNKKDLAMRVDDLNVGDNAAAAHPTEFAELLKEREAAGLRTTLYSCTEHSPGNFSLSDPSESYWSIVNAAKMGTAGFLRWAYDAWVEDPLRDTTHNAFEAGDCFLIFPDEKDADVKTSKSSVRLERMAEGIRDVNKLKLIEKKDSSFAEQIQALYAKISTTAGISRSYMSDTNKERLAQEMSDFKKGVANITEKYMATVTPGLHPEETEKTLLKGEKWQISYTILSDTEDVKVVFESEDSSVASVDAKGIVTARGAGETAIILANKELGYRASVKITVPKQTSKPVEELCISNALTDYELPEKYLSDVLQGPKTGDEHYLGQPDMIMLDDNKTLYTVFPVGHGKGRVIMMVSHDAGETWERKENIPESWSNSYETPTLYKLNLKDGTTKLIMISGRPENFGAPTGGWDTSISDDEGETWTEFRSHWPNVSGSFNQGVVVMASLIQMKENGEYIDKWMGVYHNGNNFINYKSYLTFDEDGNDQWTEPEPYLSKWRDIESSHQICEVGLFRSPDGNRIVGLARNQTHNGPATMFYSDDEGETWSKPVPLPGSLAGERHKVLYDPTDPTGQRIIIPFREIIYDLNGNNQFDGNSDWLAGDWVAWVGTYDDLINQRDGSYRILLCRDWAANAKSGDTGYTGFVVQPDGTFIMDTYGHWDKEYSESLPNYNVHNDWCWIKQAKFKLSEMAEEFGFAETEKDSIRENLVTMPEISDSSDYTLDTWNEYKNALENVQKELNNADTTYDKLQAVYEALQKAYGNLVVKGTDKELMIQTKQELIQEIEKYKDLKNGGNKIYTEESWKAFLGAYAYAEETVNSDNLDFLTKALSDLRTMYGGLTQINKSNQNQTDTVSVKAFDIDGNSYQVINALDGTVKLMKGSDTKKVTVDTVTYGGKKYRVVAIAANAFLKYKKLKSVIIGKNVINIEKNAFNNCSKLSKVTFKGEKLPSMKKAFKKTGKKVTVKVQKALKKNAKVKKKTQKTLKKAGFKVALNNIK